MGVLGDCVFDNLEYEHLELAFCVTLRVSVLSFPDFSLGMQSSLTYFPICCVLSLTRLRVSPTMYPVITNRMILLRIILSVGMVC